MKRIGQRSRALKLFGADAQRHHAQMQQALLPPAFADAEADRRLRELN